MNTIEYIRENLSVKISVKELAENAYPGRGIVIGKSQDGKYAVTASGISVSRKNVLAAIPYRTEIERSMRPVRCSRINETTLSCGSTPAKMNADVQEIPLVKNSQNQKPTITHEPASMSRSKSRTR